MSGFHNFDNALQKTGINMKIIIFWDEEDF